MHGASWHCTGRKRRATGSAAQLPTSRHSILQTLQLIAAVHGWRRGVVVCGVRRMNEVNARRARLVPGWVTVFGRVYHYHLGM